MRLLWKIQANQPELGAMYNMAFAGTQRLFRGFTTNGNIVACAQHSDLSLAIAHVILERQFEPPRGQVGTGFSTWEKQVTADFADYCDGTNLSEHARGTVSAPAPDRSLHAAAIIENSYDFRPATKSTQRDCKLARRYRRFSGGTQMNHLNDCLAHPYSERRRVNNHS